VIDDYLARLGSALPGDACDKGRILDEVRDHLLEGAQSEMARGASSEEATRRAIQRFGAPEQIAGAFATHRQRWPARLRRWGALAVGRNPMSETPSSAFRCSFCGKSRDQVGRLIAGPNFVYICNECVALCNQILAENEGKPQPSPA
jgi:hypothetical protein